MCLDIQMALARTVNQRIYEIVGRTTSLTLPYLSKLGSVVQK